MDPEPSRPSSMVWSHTKKKTIRATVPESYRANLVTVLLTFIMDIKSWRIQNEKYLESQISSKLHGQASSKISETEAK